MNRYVKVSRKAQFRTLPERDVFHIRFLNSELRNQFVTSPIVSTNFQAGHHRNI
jgi:hypothetical protein